MPINTTQNARCPSAHEIVRSSLLHATCKICGTSVDIPQAIATWIELRHFGVTPNATYHDAYTKALRDVLTYLDTMQVEWGEGNY